MFPKAIGVLPTLQTPTISAVVQDGANYYVTYTLGTIQSMYPVTVDFLVADVVILSSTLNPQAPTAYTNANQAFGTYAQGAEVKVRVTSLGQVYTSAAFTTTYAAFSGSFGSLSNNLTECNAFSQGTSGYEWVVYTLNMLATAGYYNENILIYWEFNASAPSPGYSDNKSYNKSWPAVAGDQVYGTDEGETLLTPHLGGGDYFRVTITVSAAGYSQVLTYTPFSNL